MLLPSFLFALLAPSVVYAGILLPIPNDRELWPRASTTTSAAASTASVADAACTNGPFTRQCWGNGFSIATDYDSTWPVTGNTKSYNLEITNTTGAPDGTERIMFNINGQMPGPTIMADWGDVLSITVTNKMQNNGTGIHWHGIRQWKSAQNDGVGGITECPIAPGESRTYTFLCTQFGSTWYHSHITTQYGDGVQGTIIINGPATANYDVDLGTMTVQDWYHITAQQWAIRTQAGAAPPTADNALINGTMVAASGGTGGAYHSNTITKGKKYRLRLVNTSVDNMFKVSLDGHPFTVITADFVPIKPYTANWIFLGIGERYDVIITANQTVGSYWFRAEVQTGCGNNANNGNIKSIFTYTGANSTTPDSTATTYTNSCDDESPLVPYVALDVPSDDAIPQSSVLNVSLSRITTVGNATQVQWNLNETAMQVDWRDPTLEYVITDNTTYPEDLNIITLPSASAWTYWVIQQTGAVLVPHPIHLHGHDFYLLGTGTGTYDDSAALDFTNPPRRDVAMLPATGWMVIAFITDNPGAWIMHCHIAWHVSEGLAAQFLERADDIDSTLNIDSSWKDNCASFKTWYNDDSIYKQDDSGV